MARQGKLHSSPFHIETASYMYAIEHENDGYAIKREATECAYVDKSKTRCSLWNSGFGKCFAFKCPYKQSELQRSNAKCGVCAFFYNGKCKQPLNPQPNTEHKDEARYCKYFLSEQEQKERYWAVRKSFYQIMLTRELDGYERRIKAWQRYIKKAKKEIARYEVGTDDYVYLNNKISDRDQLIAQAVLRIVDLKSKLQRLGGPLRELPKSICLK